MRTLYLAPLILALLLAAALSGARPALAEAQLTCHFFVIPAAAAVPGGEATVTAFKAELARLAGGFTALGQANGGMIAPGGQFETDAHEVFVVSAKKDLTKDIRHLVKTILKRDNLYLVTWPVTGGYLPNE